MDLEQVKTLKSLYHLWHSQCLEILGEEPPDFRVIGEKVGAALRSAKENAEDIMSETTDAIELLDTSRLEEP